MESYDETNREFWRAVLLKQELLLAISNVFVFQLVVGT